MCVSACSYLLMLGCWSVDCASSRQGSKKRVYASVCECMRWWFRSLPLVLSDAINGAVQGWKSEADGGRGQTEACCVNARNGRLRGASWL